MSSLLIQLEAAVVQLPNRISHSKTFSENNQTLLATCLFLLKELQELLDFLFEKKKIRKYL